ncbi:MAG: helix-turn-helix domain-containing protein [Sneathiellales bacterium]|nr:helix-turn-helix domain-containing protein [Sneathiellales bacterium]
MSLQKLKEKAFENEKVKEEYERLNEEFSLIDTLLSMRQQSGLTQDDIAENMGTQKSNISRLEKGRGNASWKTLQNYVHACGFKIEMNFKKAN